MRLFVWGIDSLDRAILEQNLEALPNFRALVDESGLFPYASTQPPDSHTAWPSIYTGMNPAEHGIVDFVDPLEKSQRKLHAQADNAVLKGRSFWDSLGRAGGRVCVLFPHVGFPPWDVNGVMVARDEVAGEVRASDPSMVAGEDLASLMVLTGMPRGLRSLRAYVRKGHALVDREAAFSLRMFAREPWDLFFTYSSVADWFCHYFWSFADPADPTYPGRGNEFERVILDLYRHYDRILGEYRQAAGDAAFVVVSDHGHGLRPPRVVNLNEMLRARGWLVPAEGAAAAGRSAMLRRGAEIVARNRWTWGLAKTAVRLAPALKREYTAPSAIDWSRTLAYTTDQSGLKAYNYGGIVIRREALGTEPYEVVRSQIAEALLDLRDPASGRRLVRSCVRREDLYRGPYIAKYPDLVFELEQGHGAGWGVGGSLVEAAGTHSVSPGSHRRDTAVLLVTPRQPVREVTPMQVHEILLGLARAEAR